MAKACNKAGCGPSWFSFSKGVDTYFLISKMGQLVWPRFSCACGSFNLIRATRPNLTTAKLRTLLLSMSTGECPQIWLCLFWGLLQVWAPISWGGKASAPTPAVQPTPQRQPVNPGQPQHRCTTTPANCYSPSPPQSTRQLGVSPQDTLKMSAHGCEPRRGVKEGLFCQKSVLHKQGTSSGEKSRNQVLEKQQLSCQCSNANHPTDTALATAVG